jgi:hypothetical protein
VEFDKVVDAERRMAVWLHFQVDHVPNKELSVTLVDVSKVHHAVLSFLQVVLDDLVDQLFWSISTAVSVLSATKNIFATFGGGKPYKAWKGIIFRALCNHHSAIRSHEHHLFRFVKCLALINPFNLSIRLRVVTSTHV